MHTLPSLRASELVGIKRLDLPSCGLTQFPEEIFALADTLEILNLSGNALSSLPDDLSRLRKLRVIFCSDNHFSDLPEVLGRCPRLEMIGFKANQIHRLSAAALPKSLRWLILTDNQLTELPAQLGSCTRLQKLMLAGNQLQSLPEEMAACTNLELLRIAANRFTELPAWLLSLPRLAWLAYAGNPFSDINEITAVEKHSITNIDWQSLELQSKLGEGASGVIHRAKLQSANSSSSVAVKMFKGALTSDGLPRSEKAACIAAGAHPGLIPVAGKISGHPEGRSGLVMSLIAPNFENLAAPPSLDSCTRDIYTAETRFTVSSALNIALRIASVAEHLHAQGVMHGDLYAHNILWDRQDNCLMGDFGAASFIPQQDANLAEALQRLEVRAFACLLEELIDRCDASREAQHILEALRNLKCHCELPEVEGRPLFDEIQHILESLYNALQ
jgi:hypothetical protein